MNKSLQNGIFSLDPVKLKSKGILYHNAFVDLELSYFLGFLTLLLPLATVNHRIFFSCSKLCVYAFTAISETEDRKKNLVQWYSAISC